MTSGDHDVSDAPGWDAIDDALARIYGDADPRHVAYHPPPPASTNLQGCSAYAAGDHWHYVTYGLSELFRPGPGADPEQSGRGFEFTLRVRRGSEPAAPGWPFTMLNELAKYVNADDVLVQEGHRMDLRGPVTGYPRLPDAPPTGLTVYAFTLDPQLGEIRTPNGRVAFLQAVGVTAVEKRRMQESRTATVLAELARTDPYLVTDPGRA